MTVQDLINELKDMDPNMTVRFAYNYGDYWRTHVAPEIHRVEEIGTKYSGYHSMDAIDEDSENISVILS